MRFLSPLPTNSTVIKTVSWTIALVLFLLWSGSILAGEKPRIEVWLINTRCAPVSGDWEKGKERISFWRLDENQQWSEATSSSFAESGEKNTPAIFLVHGNRTTNDEAVQFAWPVYCWLSKQDSRQLYRIVIWSWPSTRTNKRHRLDVQTKACYCDSQSYYLADCLQNVKSETPVSLIGYSFGARIIAGGLHLLGGGTLAGRCLPESASLEAYQKRSGPTRTVLVAAAFDCHALAPGYQFGNAVSQAGELLVTRNGCDDALRWYPLLYRRGGPDALGYTGPCCGNREKINIFEATGCVGKSHHWEDYIYCPNLFSVLPHYLFAEEK